MTDKQLCTVLLILIALGSCWIGYLIGSMKSFPTKKYPLDVSIHFPETQVEFEHTAHIYADSVKADTIWKDGAYIVNKNITNVTFKQ